MLFARPLVLAGLGGLLSLGAALLPVDAGAQQIYRSTAPDGRVTFSDRAIDGAAPAPAVPLAAASAAADTVGLPYELRQAATRYPVTLYSAPECAPCTAGRTLLVGRGVPFAEKSVTSHEDIQALTRIAGAPTLPVLAVGGQHLNGFADQEWAQLLDAAGYPRTSQLPPGYQRAASAPLVAVQPVKPTASAPRPATASAAPPKLPPPPPAQPYDSGGIRF